MQLPSTSRQPIPRYSWMILGLATITQASISLVTQGVPTMAAFVQAEYALSNGVIGLFSTLVNTGSFFSYLPVGKAIDIYGERAVVGLGAVVSALVVMSMLLIHSLPLLFVMAFLLGLGLATGTPGGTKAIKSWFPREHWGLGIGIRQMGVPIGGTIAALILPPLSVKYGWRVAIFVAGAICMLFGIIYLCTYREANAPHKLDKQEMENELSFSALLALFKNSVFRSLCLLSIVLVASQFIVVTYLILYLTVEVQIPIVMSGVFLSVAQSFGMFGRVFFGWASDFFFQGNRRQCLFIVTLLNALFVLLIAFARPGMSTALLMALTAMLGCTSIGWNGLYITFMSDLTKDVHAGSAVSMGLTITQFGVMFGPPLFGVVIDITGSYRIAWILLSLITFASLALFRGMKQEVHEPI